MLKQVAATKQMKLNSGSAADTKADGAVAKADAKAVTADTKASKAATDAADTKQLKLKTAEAAKL